MSINLDEWKDYERSHKYVEAAKFHKKTSPGLTLFGVKNVINKGSIVHEDLDYIKSIVGLNDSVQGIH